LGELRAGKAFGTSTMENTRTAKERLRDLYAETSKHGQYQTLPAKLADALDLQFEVNEEWRGDRPRYPLIRDFVAANGCRTVLDVGANTGFFALSLAGDVPGLKVTACELNKTHARIIELLAEVGGYELPVTDRPADAEHVDRFGHFDCALHLNILHHAGHDFDGALVPDRTAFQAYAVDYLKRFRTTAERMVFQMGYNWRGDKTLPLIERDDQAGKVRFTLDLFERSGWEVEGVAFARKGAGIFPIEYDRYKMDELPPQGAALQTWLTARYGEAVWSEFYQRPMWFCRASR